MSRARIAVAVLTLSAAGLFAILEEEEYVGEAMIPTKNDVPTIGFGSTTREDGSAVQLGDKTTPIKALRRTMQYIKSDEKDFKATLAGVELYPEEFDLYLNWRYQYGAGRWRSSSILRELKAGNYTAACNALLLYKYSGGFDCSTPGNRVCSGVWTRQLKRHAACMALQ